MEKYSIPTHYLRNIIILLLLTFLLPLLFFASSSVLNLQVNWAIPMIATFDLLFALEVVLTSQSRSLLWSKIAFSPRDKRVFAFSMLILWLFALLPLRLHIESTIVQMVFVGFGLIVSYLIIQIFGTTALKSRPGTLQSPEGVEK